VANAIGEFYALKSRHIHNLCLGAKGLTGRITSLEGRDERSQEGPWGGWADYGGHGVSNSRRE
jgi:hypothetical protein